MSSEKVPVSSEGASRGGFVPAVVARSFEEADRYRALLDDHDIPAIVATDEDLERFGAEGCTTPLGVPVLVSEAMLDEATEVIADREDVEDFHVGEEDAIDEDEADDFEYDEGRVEKGFQGIFEEEEDVGLLDDVEADHDEGEDDSGNEIDGLSDDDEIL